MPREEHKDVDRLLAGLDHRDESVRVESLRALVAAPGAPLLRVLRKTARSDASPTVRAEALRLLAEAADRLSGADLSGDQDSTRREVLLNDPDSKVRAQAVAALTMSFDARVPEILLAALEREQDPGVLETLIQSLSSEGPNVAPRLVPFLTHADPRVRTAAVEVLGDTKDDSLLAHLVPLLEDRHERVRVAAVRALRSARQEAVLACVDEMLKRSSERDVRAALYVLRYFASAISVPRLVPLLGGSSPSVGAMARASLASLSKKGSKRAKRALERSKAVSGATPLPVTSGGFATRKALDPEALAAADKRLESVFELVKAGRKDQLPGVRGRLDQEDDPRVLAAMVMAIGRLGGPGDVPLLATYLGHKRSRVRTAAVKSVAQLDPRAVSMLLPSLRDRSARVRAQGILCLAGAKGINVMGSLRQMAASRDPRVVLTAVWTAAKIKVDGAREVLEGLAGSSDADVRAEVAKALGRGPTAGRELSLDAPPPGRDESVIMSAGEVADDVTVVVEGIPPAEAEMFSAAETPANPVSRASAWGHAPEETRPRTNTHRTATLKAGGPADRVPDAPPGPPAFAAAGSARLDVSGLALDDGSLPGSGISVTVNNQTFLGEPISAEPSGVEEVPPGPPAAADAHAHAKAGALSAALAQAQAGGGVRRGDSTRVGTRNTARVPGTRTKGDGEQAPRRRPPVALAGGIAAVFAVVLMVALMPPPAVPVPTPPVATSAPPPVAPTVAPSLAASGAPPELKITFAPMAAPPASLFNPPGQTLEEVEAAIKSAHASRGITAKPIIHLMALDFMQSGYRNAIARARETASQGQVMQALAGLEAALEKLASDHLTGRVAVMRALVTIAREGEQFDRLKRYRTDLLAEQQKLIEVATEAAKDGGLRDHELKNLLARIKEAEKQKAEATRSADWLSGQNMFEEQPGTGNGSGG